MPTCLASDAAHPCSPVVADAPLPLCPTHLLDVHDYVAGELGVEDALPSPCVRCGSRLGVHWPSGWSCAVCEWRVGEVPDGSDGAPRVDVVYYLRRGDRIKIGTSSNPRQRFQALHWDELLAFERGDRLVEHRRHEEFAEDRLGTGEWFAASERLLAHVAEIATGVDDPWARHARWVSEATRAL